MSDSTAGPSQTTNQQQATQTDPWGPAQPLLKDVLAKLGQQGTNVTPTQQAGSQQLISEASQVPQFAPQATNTVNSLFGSSYAPQSGILGSAYTDLLKNTGSIADPNNLNPYNTPGFSDALNTNKQDITNKITSMFAAGGRAVSPEEAQALSRGLTQGTAPTIASQYNANADRLLQANQGRFGAGSGTATGQAALTEQGLMDQINAIAAGGAVPGLLTQPGSTLLAASNTSFGLPYQNIGALESLLNPIAGLGSSGYGTGTSTTTSSQPLINTILSGVALAGGLGGKFMASDVRFKENVKPVGVLFDGLPVYKYNYKSDPAKRPQIGLLAQDVEQMMPHAVAEDERGMKYVNYDLATAPSANSMAA